MALLEDVLGGWTGMLVGIGAVVVFPAIGPAVSSIVRPTAKALIKGSLFISDQVTGLAGAAAGEVRDLVSDAKSEPPKTSGTAVRPVPKASRP